MTYISPPDNVTFPDDLEIDIALYDEENQRFIASGTVTGQEYNEKREESQTVVGSTDFGKAHRENLDMDYSKHGAPSEADSWEESTFRNNNNPQHPKDDLSWDEALENNPGTRYVKADDGEWARELLDENESIIYAEGIDSEMMEQVEEDFPEGAI